MMKKGLFSMGINDRSYIEESKSMPKDMLPVGNKPLGKGGVEESIAAGLSEVGFVTGRGKRAIGDHFDLNYELEREIAGTNKEEYLTSIREVMDKGQFSFTRQTSMKGLGDAILNGRRLIGDEPFGVVLSDDLCLTEAGEDGVLTQMVKLFKQFRCSIVAIQEVPEDQVSKFGVIAGEHIKDNLYQVTDMVATPSAEDAPSN